MNRYGCCILLRKFLLLLALGAVTTVQADISGAESRYKKSYKTGVNASPAAMVDYDKASDQLSINADDVSLMQILARVAQKSGIEVLFDEQADEQVSLDVQSEPLEKALKRMLKGRNHLMRYSRDEQQKLLLIGVLVLPEGVQDRGRAKRLMAIDDEAAYRARNPLSLEQMQKMDLANQRWQARLSELPPARREMLEKRVSARLQKEAALEQRRAESRKMKQQLNAQKKAARLKRREAVYQGLDEEQRAALEQSRNASREQMKSLLLGGQN